MTPDTYDFGTYVAEDSVQDTDFTITLVENGVTRVRPLDGAEARMTFRDSEGQKAVSLAFGNGLTASADGNTVRMSKFYAPSAPGRYRYDLQIDFAGDIRRTTNSGTLIVVEGVTTEADK